MRCCVYASAESFEIVGVTVLVLSVSRMVFASSSPLTKLPAGDLLSERMIGNPQETYWVSLPQPSSSLPPHLLITRHWTRYQTSRHE